MGADVHDIADARLRADGQRYTEGRRSLVAALQASDHPLSIPELLVLEPELAQSSAYRNLAVLERSGVVHRIITADDHGRYELAEDLTEHHHHLICGRCGSVRDFVVPAAVERRLDEVAAAAAAEAGFAVEHHRFDLIGRCEQCR